MLHTENDGPTFVQKQLVHEIIFHHLGSENWSFFMTNLHCYSSSIST